MPNAMMLIAICFSILISVSWLFREPYNIIGLIVGAVGFITFFLIQRAQVNRLILYWNRCREMSHKLNRDMIDYAMKGDEEMAASCGRRGQKVLELWRQSLKTHTIPKEPDLDDL